MKRKKSKREEAYKAVLYMKKQQIKKDQIKKEPFLRLVKRDVLSVKKIILIYAIAILASLVLSAIICSLFSSKSPLAFFEENKEQIIAESTRLARIAIA